MSRTNVIAIFDIGKTNKKFHLFNELYELVYEEVKQFPELKDEDNFPCEDIDSIVMWMQTAFHRALVHESYTVKALNFSAYGASFVYLDANNKIIKPLYNYFKPYPENLAETFYEAYGGKTEFARKTASPILGHLNSGLQLYRLKCQSPEKYKTIKHALHLPQFLSFLFTGHAYSEITSIGCHTALWDFDKMAYHTWVKKEKVNLILPPIISNESNSTLALNGIFIGHGLHDSSAAIIPYLSSIQHPFLLISTGSWSICMNPFNNHPLSETELLNDCLMYLSYLSLPIKSSRLNAGFLLEDCVNKLCKHFGNSKADYFNIEGSPQFYLEIEEKLKQKASRIFEVHDWKNHKEAYTAFMWILVDQQVEKIKLVSSEVIKHVYVDGGFSTNHMFMQLLAIRCKDYKIFAAEIGQSTSLGAALAMHANWNTKMIPQQLIQLKEYK
jgi:sugar (pentulose or hexulose) kinase